MTLDEGFEPAIGLEVHAELLTQSKIFCDCKVAFGESPNSLTCPVCLGLPGALPVLNKTAVELAIRMVLAIGGSVNRQSGFARKNYFYPDLPKGYQISQYDRPLGEGGRIEYETPDGVAQCCGVVRIHLEEDAGKSLHPRHGEPCTRIDFNRCGVPLIEIVGQPDLRTPEQAHAYLLKLKQLLQYLGVCSGDMEKGHLRCDANVSIRPKKWESLGTRTEIKNLNSFRAVRKALEFELQRQIGVIRAGGSVHQSTLFWDEKKLEATPMRSKEEATDYRYFPEPDLPDLLIDEAWLDEIKQSLPELPDARRERMTRQYGIRAYDAAVLSDSRGLADYYEQAMLHFEDGQMAANWIQTELLGQLGRSGEDVASSRLKPEALADLLRMVRSAEISAPAAKSVLAEAVVTGESPREIVRRRNLGQISDPSALTEFVARVVEEWPQAVSQYRAGKTAAIRFLIGKVMGLSKGRANPEIVGKMLRDRLDEGDR